MRSAGHSWTGSLRPCRLIKIMAFYSDCNRKSLRVSYLKGHFGCCEGAGCRERPGSTGDNGEATANSPGQEPRAVARA